MSQSKYTSKLVDKLVVIFGGTSGVGFCVAEASLEHGASVFISGSNPTRLLNALDRLRTSYPSIPAERIRGGTCDLADTHNVEENLIKLLDTITENKAAKIDHIVFTAGDALKFPALKDATPETFLALANVRVVSAVILAKLIPTYMTISPSSSFTVTGGSNTQKPMLGWAIIAAWGGTQEGLMRGLAVDLAPMRVNLVSLGAVKTELFDGLPQEALEATLEGFKEQTTVKEVGKPENVAEAYLYIMKDRFVTGAIVETNGGRLLV
jgi:NAD(P)-dependent dehydrogenase (short-subunit alcohol dehydrogenase family)